MRAATLEAPPRAPTVRAATASVVVPAYNEELGIAHVLEQLRAALGDTAEIIVVDDGSTDRTAEIARGDGARVVRHRRKRGKGAALRTGLQAAGGERIVVIDADGTYPASEVPAMLALLDEHDIVVGARTAGRAHIPRTNRLGNAAFRTVIRRLSGFRSADPLTGLYAVRRERLERLDLRSNGFGLEAEIAMKSPRLGLSSIDHPIEYRSRLGRAKLRPMRDGLAVAATILREAVAAALASGSRRSRRPR